jgi:hypothetical protein
MTCDYRWRRREFLATGGAIAAGIMLGRPPEAHALSVEDLPQIQLKSWEVIELPNRSERFRTFIRIKGGDGSLGYCRALGGVGKGARGGLRERR